LEEGREIGRKGERERERERQTNGEKGSDFKKGRKR
jgi:hypothetical protein